MKQQCVKCRIEKSTEEFYLAGNGEQRRTDCKDCVSVSRRARYSGNRTEELLKQREYYSKRKASGYKGPRLKTIWANMIQRCTNVKHSSYQYYGGRGISVCDKWRDYETFATEMSAGYQDGLTLDRIDNEKGYSLDNCRWATYAQQARNRSDNVVIEYAGKSMCLADWAKELLLDYDVLYARIAVYKWPIKDAFTIPILGRAEASRRKFITKANLCETL